MKKFITPSLLAFGLLFSCNNDDDSSNNFGTSILGEWKLVKDQIESSKDGKIIDEEVADECTSKSNVVFTETKISDTYYENYNDECVLDYTIESEYKIDGNKIIVVENGENYVSEIVKLTANELIIKSSFGEDIDGDGKDEFSLIHYKK